MLTIGRQGVGHRSARPSEPPSATEGLVMLALGRGPRTVDEVSEAAGLSLGEAAGVLAVLELRGRACRVGPGRFVLGP